MSKVPKQLNIPIELPNNVIVVSDIHLSANSTTASRNVELQIGQQLKKLMKVDNATVVLNGDIFELWAGKELSVQKAIKAHKGLCDQLKEFSQIKNHNIYYVIGNHDGKIAWDNKSQQLVTNFIGAKMCLSLNLIFKGSNRKDKFILFEHGNQLDPDNAFADPYDPNDKPFGQHIVQNALPIVYQTQGKLFEGINHLSEPHKFAKFLASRILYREIFSRLWLLFIPLLFLLILRIFIEYGFFVNSGASINKVAQFVLFTEIAVFVNAVVLIAGGALITGRLLSRAKNVPGIEADVNHNMLAQKKARLEISNEKIIGYITGHTHRPQILKIKNGFYANSGCGTEMVEACTTRFGLPKTYVSRNHLHWLNIYISKDDITLTHWQMIILNKNQSLLEKIATKRKHFEFPLSIQKEIKISH